MRILIVEDEVKMAGLLRRGLRAEGIAADVATTGEDALWMAGATEYDAIVLDVMLPGIDGFEVCRRLRADGVWAPVLMLTARDGVSRPGRRARRRRRRLPDQAVLLRRAARPAAGPGPARARSSGRPSSRSATCGSTRPRGGSGAARRRSSSRPRSSRCSRRSCAAPGEVLSRFELLEHAWDYEYENRSNVVDVYVRYLRREDRPAVRRPTRSRPCAAPATGCARTAGR